MIFSLAELGRFLSRIRTVAPIRSLAEWDGRERAVLLRHDIDLDVVAAHRLCSFEAELGVRSSVLFLTSCETYNVLSRQSRRRIREIADLGFDVGLHFDPTLYGAVETFEPYVAQEAAILADVAGHPVRTISLHNPSLHGHYPVFDGYINAYQAPYFDSRFYLSDSCMDFRGKDPYDVVEWAAQDRVQILLHPLHFGETAQEYPSIIQRYLRELEDRIDSAFTEQNGTYRVQRRSRTVT